MFKTQYKLVVGNNGEWSGVNDSHSSSDFPQQINTSITKSTIRGEESLPLLSSEWPFPFLMGPWWLETRPENRGFFNILVLCSIQKLKDSYSSGRYEVNDRIERSLGSKKKKTDRSEEEEEGEEEATTKRAERKWIQEDEEGERGDVNGEEGLDEEDVVWILLRAFIYFLSLSLSLQIYQPRIFSTFLTNQSNLEADDNFQNTKQFVPGEEMMSSAFRPPLSEYVFVGDRSTQLASSSSPRLLFGSLSLFGNVGFLSRESMRNNKKKVSSE